MSELERLSELRKYDILDTPEDDELNELVMLASAICNTPISLVSLIDENRQWFKANVGLAATETPRDIAFCNHAIQQEEIFIVPNASEDSRFKDNPLVTADPNIRFYAGMPLTTKNGFKLGTLCIIDRVPRELNDNQRFALKVLTKQVMKQLENRRYLKKIEYQNKELGKLNAQKDKIFSIVSHDLKSPIASLNSLLTFYNEGDMDEVELKPFLKKLSHNVSITLQLLENVLTWAKVQIKTEVIKVESLNLNSLVDTVIERQINSIHNKNIKINNLVSNSVYLNTDRQMVDLVLRNLIANAVKFCNYNGLIEISTNINQHHIEINIADNGVGISPEVLPKLFKQTEHVTTYGTANEKGTGLGLVLCKEYIKKLGGTISVTSTPNIGSTFTFTLPT